MKRGKFCWHWQLRKILHFFLLLLLLCLAKSGYFCKTKDPMSQMIDRKKKILSLTIAIRSLKIHTRIIYQINSCRIFNLPLSPGHVWFNTTEAKNLQNLTETHKKWITEYVCAGQARTPAQTSMHCKVASSNTSHLEAHAGFFRLLMKGIFNLYVLWYFDKKLISELVTRVRTRDYTVVMQEDTHVYLLELLINYKVTESLFHTSTKEARRS